MAWQSACSKTKSITGAGFLAPPRMRSTGVCLADSADKCMVRSDDVRLGEDSVDDAAMVDPTSNAAMAGKCPIIRFWYGMAWASADLSLLFSKVLGPLIASRCQML